MGGKVVVYMGVTADKYEFPLFHEDSLWELAEITGIKKPTLASYITKDKKNHGVRFFKLELDDEE